MNAFLVYCGIAQYALRYFKRSNSLFCNTETGVLQYGNGCSAIRKLQDCNTNLGQLHLLLNRSYCGIAQ